MSEHVAPPWESAFRHRMKALRDEQFMTQAELAAHATKAGLPFHQQTIQRIESGTRPIRLNEAGVIAAALGARLADMSRPETNESARKDLATATERLALTCESFGSPPASYSDELRERMDDAKAARDHYKVVCKSLGNAPDESILNEFVRNLAKGHATLKLLAHQGAAWSLIASIGTGEAYNEPDPLKLDEIERFAQQPYTTHERGEEDFESGAFDAPVRSSQAGRGNDA